MIWKITKFGRLVCYMTSKIKVTHLKKVIEQVKIEHKVQYVFINIIILKPKYVSCQWMQDHISTRQVHFKCKYKNKTFLFVQ